MTIAAQAVGVAQGALDYALGYAKERKQFGQAIADFQALQFLLADMGMKVEAARQMTYVLGRGQVRARRCGPDVLRCRGQVLRVRRRDGGHHQRGPGAGWLRVHP